MKSFLKIFLFIFAMVTTVEEVKSSTVVEGLVHLAADNASIGDIEDALSSKNFEYQKDASVEGGFMVDTEKQYKGWAATQIFSPEIVGEILFMSLGTGSSAERVTEKTVSKTTTVAAQAAKTGTSLWPAASGGRTVINGIEYTTHALERMQPIGTAIDKAGKLASRGITPSVVENAIKHGTVSAGRTAGEVVRIFENVKVITNPQGTRVITVYKLGH